MHKALSFKVISRVRSLVAFHDRTVAMKLLTPCDLEIKLLFAGKIAIKMGTIEYIGIRNNISEHPMIKNIRIPGGENSYNEPDSRNPETENKSVSRVPSLPRAIISLILRSARMYTISESNALLLKLRFHQPSSKNVLLHV